MKKFIGVLFVFTIFFASCEKNLDYLANDESTICFNVDVFPEGKPLTRGFSNEEIINLISSSLPAFYYIRATNLTNGNTYNFTTQNPVVLPNGKYLVETREIDKIDGDTARWDSKRKKWNSNLGHRCDDNFAYVGGVPGVILCNSPRITAKDTIIISKNETISLKGIIGSSAIVWDANIVEKIQILEGTGANYIFDLKCFVQKDNLCITFHQETNPRPVDIMIYPKTGLDYEKKKMTIPRVLKEGYWYLISPTQNQNSDTDFTIGITNFQNAGEL